ncbi:MAG TPA: tetratricopeptide repeat protein, partial [Kofleriaceae bacterium]|nr:tetratricopeptide repeat protein [Kofleriaceae bacterium]
SSRAREAACTAQGDTVRGDFGAFARNAIQRAFAATGAPFAQSAFAHASAVLDRYSEQLAVQTVAACHGGDDSPRIAAARRACLAERAAELVGLVDVLSHADAGVVQRAPNAAWAIFDPAPCNDAHVLLEAPAVPRTPEQAAFLGKLRAFDDAGRYQDGIALAKPQLDAARARGDRDAELDLSLVLGQLDEEVAPPEQIAPIYERALELAEASGRDLDAAVALIRLANLTGSVQHQHAAAHRQLDLARAKLARLGGGNVAIRATLLDTEGEVLMDENRLGEAETALREAAKELAQAYGDDHPQLGNALGTLSEILRGEGKQAESLEVSRHTADVLRRALGDEHPTVAGAELNLATALVWMHRDDEARPLLAHADAVFARTFGDDHPVRAAVYGSLGELERDQSHWDAAIDAFRKALAVLVKLGDVAGQAGARGDLARTLSLAGRGDEAVAEQTKVVAIYEQLGPDGAPRLPAALADLADIDTARGKPALAVPIAERAVALAEARPADANPDDLADARLALAAALWDAGRDRTRARALAEKARAAYTDPARVGRAAQWLADHR